ncbi:hypothetical protein BpHYR1_025395 [Brachionus plicatilis]|uniref:Uncharacterized protein n=1 Tax=Brachionus plicatilis TaxID=10195 RepID=A0A3M7RH51_BRAPC|nr:hypothetical protein BpHYR1_025395 [Brachionus plicatilis]
MFFLWEEHDLYHKAKSHPIKIVSKALARKLLNLPNFAFSGLMISIPTTSNGENALTYSNQNH